MGQCTEARYITNVCLSTRRPLWGPMSFAPMAASSRIDGGEGVIWRVTVAKRLLPHFIKYVESQSRSDCCEVTVAKRLFSNFVKYAEPQSRSDCTSRRRGEAASLIYVPSSHGLGHRWVMNYHIRTGFYSLLFLIVNVIMILSSHILSLITSIKQPRESPILAIT